MALKIGVRLESLGLPLRKALQEAARLSVPGVQVDAAGDLAPTQLSQTGRREFRHLLRSYNLELTAVGCPLRRGLDTLLHLDERIDHVKAVLSLSYDLGPRVVVVQAGKVPTAADDDRPRTPAFPGLGATRSGLLLAGTDDLDNLVAGLSANEPAATVIPEVIADLGSYAERIGATLALDAGLEAGTVLGQFLARFDTGGLGANFDPANLLLNGFDPYDGARGLGGRIVHATGRDGRRASTRRSAGEVALGNGDIDWLRLLAVLEEVGYRGWMTVVRDEGDQRAADVASGVAFLRRLG